MVLPLALFFLRAWRGALPGDPLYGRVGAFTRREVRRARGNDGRHELGLRRGWGHRYLHDSRGTRAPGAEDLLCTPSASPGSADLSARKRGILLDCWRFEHDASHPL